MNLMQEVLNRVIDLTNNLQPVPLQWLEAENALCVWEWFLDAEQEGPHKATLEEIRGNVGSVALRQLSLSYGAILERVLQVAKARNYESFDCPFDWEIVPLAMRLELESGFTFLLSTEAEKIAERLDSELSKVTA